MTICSISFLCMVSYIRCNNHFNQCIRTCRQKENISHLQEQVRESEARIHLLMTAKAMDEGGGALNVRLKVCMFVC